MDGIQYNALSEISRPHSSESIDAPEKEGSEDSDETEESIRYTTRDAVSPNERLEIAQRMLPKIQAYIQLQPKKYVDTVVSMMIIHFLVNASGDSTFHGIQSREFLCEAMKIEKFILETYPNPEGVEREISDCLRVDSGYQARYDSAERKLELLPTAQSELSGRSRSSEQKSY